MTKRTLIPGVSALVVAAAAATAIATAGGGGPADPDRPTPPRTPGGGQVIAANAELASFKDCGELTTYARTHAIDTVFRNRSFGFTTGSVAPMAAEADTSARATGAAGAASAAAPKAKQAGEDFSATNNQEQGVDEPDTVKTDGNRLFTIAEGRLRSVDVSDPATPRTLDDLALDGGYGGEMLLLGDRLMIISSGSMDEDRDANEAPSYHHGGPMSGGAAVLTEVDVSDPAALKLVKTVRMEGSYLSGRLTGSTARIVVNSVPDVIADPFDGDYPDSEIEARRRARQAVDEADSQDWLPRVVVEDADDNSRATSFVGCDDVAHAREFSGLNMLSVLTIDLSKGIDPVDTDTLMSDADTVYASETGLYLTSRRYETRGSRFSFRGRRTEQSTAIHKFDTRTPNVTSFQASGKVEGSLLNQFSMSELDGRLRVATTTGQPSGCCGDVIVEEGPAAEQSESAVYVLEQEGDALVKVGEVGGLGKNERIYSVRFIGDEGYVVTFRQTDPLYTIDLSDPRDPKVAGELKILGYSAYLHPVGEDLLLGVGQDATEEGRRTGTQLSLFDVSDPANPRRIANRTLGESYSQAEYDHHAFLHWPKTGLTVVPLNRWSPDAGDQFVGAVGFDVSEDDIARTGSIEHPTDTPRDPNGSPYDYGAQITRSLVVGDRILTLSGNGIASSDMQMDDENFVSF